MVTEALEFKGVLGIGILTPIFAPLFRPPSPIVNFALLYKGRNTFPPVLPVICGVPETVKVVELACIYTPPPFSVTLLPVMVPPVMVNLANPHTHTPPPYCSAVLPEMVPPVMVNVPSIPAKALLMYTPPPRPLLPTVLLEMVPPVMVNWP